MCFGGSKSTPPPPPPPPPPAAPPVLEQEAPELSADTMGSGESKELNKRRRGTSKYKNEKRKGNSGSGLGGVKKIVKKTVYK